MLSNAYAHALIFVSVWLLLLLVFACRSIALVGLQVRLAVQQVNELRWGILLLVECWQEEVRYEGLVCKVGKELWVLLICGVSLLLINTARGRKRVQQIKHLWHLLLVVVGWHIRLPGELIGRSRPSIGRIRVTLVVVFLLWVLLLKFIWMADVLRICLVILILDLLHHFVHLGLVNLLDIIQRLILNLFEFRFFQVHLL